MPSDAHAGFSVIMFCDHAADLLQHALQALGNVIARDGLEVMVIDDGASDDRERVVEEAASRGLVRILGVGVWAAYALAVLLSGLHAGLGTRKPAAVVLVLFLLIAHHHAHLAGYCLGRLDRRPPA